jgi:hypothetical protein
MRESRGYVARSPRQRATARGAKDRALKDQWTGGATYESRPATAFHAEAR